MVLSNIYLLLDAARVPPERMDTAKELNPEHASLYRNPKGGDEILPRVAPFLFTASRPLSDLITEFGHGDAWGIYIDSAAGFEVLYKHFRRFLMVKKEEGTSLYFRFYDPRVLRIFLQTCDRYQLAAFFGPVARYIVEDEDPEKALIFSWSGAQLQRQQITRREWTGLLSTTKLITTDKVSFWDNL
jgi:hypothetical protein